MLTRRKFFHNLLPVAAVPVAVCANMSEQGEKQKPDKLEPGQKWRSEDRLVCVLHKYMKTPDWWLILVYQEDGTFWHLHLVRREWEIRRWTYLGTLQDLGAKR